MREILFRAKCIENKDWGIKGGQWVEGLPMYTANKSEKGKIDRILALKDGYYQIFLIDPETVCQYIGLRDKNGEKIFEWDIVKVPYRRYLGVVKFECPECQYVYQMQRDGDCIEVGEHGSEIEVIGNIFDNPDLI